MVMTYTVITDENGKNLYIEGVEDGITITIPFDKANRLYSLLVNGDRRHRPTPIPGIDIAALPRRYRDEMSRAQKIAYLKEVRRKILRSLDWTIASDSPLTTAQKTTVRNYRTTLRDLDTTITAEMLDACKTKEQLQALIPAASFNIDNLM